MPRYHFHVHDGVCLPDGEGSQLADLEAAKAFAVRMAGDMLRGDPALFWSGDEWHMDVTDEVGLTLFRLTFMATMSPSVPSARRRD